MRGWVAGIGLTCALALLGGHTSARSEGDLRVTDLKALDEALAAYKGQALLVNFWASWCEPCVDELPELVEVAREHRGKGVAVLTVSYDLVTSEATRDETLKEVGAFVTETRMDLPVFLYDGPDDSGINERFGLPGAVPVTIAIDRSGQVVDRHLGRATKKRLGALIRRALQPGRAGRDARPR